MLYTHDADNKTTAVQPSNSSSDVNFGVRNDFGINVPLPLSQSAPTLSYNTSRHCRFSATS